MRILIYSNVPTNSSLPSFLIRHTILHTKIHSTIYYMIIYIFIYVFYTYTQYILCTRWFSVIIVSINNIINSVVFHQLFHMDFCK